MEWELKPPSWDLAELERETAEPNMGFIAGSSSLGGQKSKGDCSVDLKLGRLGDFGDGSLDKWNNSRISTMAPPLPPAPSKRARAPNNGSQIFSCLVDGCKADLSNCRDYHKRHKVCEAHSKTPRVMVGGQEQRFCQQCSRFHLLAEFDEVKRSCRKRLDGHNRRRRKPQPDPMSVNSGSLFSNHQGTRFSSYMNPQIFPIAMPDASWAGVVKSEEDTLYNRHAPLHFVDRQSLFPSSFSRGYEEGKQFPFLQDSTIASSESSGSKIFADTLTRDCALSLLSTPEQTSGIGLTHMVQPPERIPMAQPLVPGIQYNGLGRYSCSQASNSVSTTGFSCSGIEDEQAGTVLVSEASDAGLHCQGIFHVAGDGSSENGPSQTLPFSWQ